MLLTSGGSADQLEVATASLQAIVTQSLLGQEAFVALMERTFERGLPHMLTCVRPYDELVDIHKDSFYDEIREVEEALIAPDRPRAPQPAAALHRALPELAEAYDSAESLDAIQDDRGTAPTGPVDGPAPRR